MFLSVIIPVYNGENYILRCLDSIWSQGLPEEDYEVICVDDCSSDNTVEVLKEEQKKHPQLRIFQNPENLRAGGARNKGVREANGEYIVFIDSDDYFHNGGLKKAYEYQKNNRLDILVCDFARHCQNSPNNILVHNFKSKDIMSGREFLVVNSLPYAPWKYIFKKDLMLDNNVFFEEKVSCEDVDWSHKIAFFANSMQYQPILLTHYLLLEGSQTASEFKNKQLLFNRLKSGKRVANLVCLYNSKEEKEKILAVAEETLKNGIIFMNALPSNPKEKAQILKTTISKDIKWKGNLIKFVALYPFTYATFSTLISPFFYTLIKLKRTLRGR